LVRPVVIEDDVWIGANVTVIGSVRIGRGAVIGACSLVNKDIKPYSIACGVPAKVIGYRFSEEMRDDLDKFRWEEYSDEEIIASRHLFSTDLNDVKDLIWKFK
jgi:serine acetyltransferase